MPTAETSIQSALFTRMASLTLSPVLPIAWPNINYTKPANGRYLRVSHLPNTTDRFSVNSDGSHQHQGILQVLVCWKINEGESAPREIAGLIANHFPPDRPLDSGSVRVRITKRADIAPAMIEDGELMIPVSIRYEAFI